MGGATGHEQQSVVDDLEAMALVEPDVGAVGGLEVAVDAVTVGELQHRREKPATESPSLSERP
jgi:hypothetical protein